ncbi:hypothetical protein Poli38472_008178 [Pythium oligandrum]|uniref:Uncharacterized protein n=1 Tax=Pythium oligandrum TaxID=41045 RepID=A0A8K1FK16_PYTOL|nr:hypothetical protein Poli38472_008178 [Pythium oligandrum]|eukprot:TMW65536.1 hypothetical protein Poli38472_008178 [Pythium oligandrum]
MGSRSVFKGALGWDDWIWWSAIGGVVLLLLLLALCCCVCVKRAKRKGRQEALAAMQARERERQQQEAAELRYAQMQQARFPARETNNNANNGASYKYSKPEPPHNNGQSYHAYRDYVQQNQGPPPPPPQQQRPMAPPPPPHQPVYMNTSPYTTPQEPRRPIVPQQPQGAFYAPKERVVAPQYTSAPPPPPPPPPQQQQQIQERSPATGHAYRRPSHPPGAMNASPLLNYRKNSAPPVVPAPPRGRADSATDTFDHDDGHPMAVSTETPFVPIASPRRTPSFFNGAGPMPTTAPPMAPANYQVPVHRDSYSRDSASPEPRLSNATSSSSTRAGATLRDRIEALREGNVQDQHTRISVESAAAAAYQVAPPSDASFTIDVNRPSTMVIAPERHPNMLTTSILSNSSGGSSSPHLNRDANLAAFDEEVYDTARSDLTVEIRNESLDRRGSDNSLSSGQFEDADSGDESSTRAQPPTRRGKPDSTILLSNAARSSTDSQSSVEF